MRTGFNTLCVMVVLIGGLSPRGFSENLADVLCSYEHGLYPVINNEGTFTNPQAVFTAATGPSDDTGIVSLGQWTDDPAQGNGINPVGIILGFSTSIVNGVGNDLKIKGNSRTGWYEPGYVEVARETSGSGATVDGWTDEDWYLLKPSNYDQLPFPYDPRIGSIDIAYNFSTGYAESYWSDQSMTGYADVDADGDFMDISWAIDMDGTEVELSDIAYVRIRTVSDSPAGPFGGFSTEIDYVEYLNGVVPTLLAGDANNDDSVDAADYTTYADNYTGVGGLGMVWEQGDFNGDGSVDAADYTIYADNYTGAPSAPVPTPEPATLFIMLSAISMGLLKKRKYS